MEVWWSGGLVIIGTDYRQYLVNVAIDKAWTLHAYWASNIVVVETENWNALAHWATRFQFSLYFENDKASMPK